MNAEQEELRQRIATIQRISVQGLDLLEQLFDRLISGEFDNQFFVIQSTLHLTLFASHARKGRQLFLMTLEYVKKIYPEIATEFWEAYDDYENIVQTNFYSLP